MNSLFSSAPKVLSRLGKKYFSSPQKSLPQNLQRILWIRLDHIGDGVMSLPSLAALRARFPESQIDALVRAPFASLLGESQLIDNIILGDSPRFPNKPGTVGRFGAFISLRKLAKQFRSKYDLAIDARGDDVARLFSYWSKTPHRLGPDRIFYEPPNAANFSFLMTHLTQLSNMPRHAVINNLANLQPLGVNETPFHWPISTAHDEEVQRLLKQREINAPFAVIQTRSNDRARDWSADGFAEVADYLVSRRGLKVLLCGAAVDIPYNNHIISLAKSTFDIHNIAGELKLTELLTLFAKAKIMISVDTGPMHLGAMAEVPIVALMLPDLALRHYPWKQPNATVIAPDEKMENINVEIVKKKIDSLLSGHRHNFQ